jgi:hypothetical protein
MLCQAVYRFQDPGLWRECVQLLDPYLCATPTVAKGGSWHLVGAARARGRILTVGSMLYHATKDSRLQAHVEDHITIQKTLYDQNGMPGRGDGISPFELAFWIMGLQAAMETFTLNNNAVAFEMQRSVAQFLLLCFKNDTPGFPYYIPGYTVYPDGTPRKTPSVAVARQCIGALQVYALHHTLTTGPGSETEKYDAIISYWKTNQTGSTKIPPAANDLSTGSNPMTATLESIQQQLVALQTERHSARLWDIALKAVIPVVIALTGWVVAMEVRVSVIESSRFTPRDGQVLRDDLVKQMALLYPPAWLRESIARIEARLGRLEDKGIPK